MTIEQETALKSILTSAHREYRKDLSARAYFKVNDPMLAEDLVQNTFMKTWNYLAKGGKIETMKAFLYHVLNNLIVDEYRKHKTSSLDVLLEKGFEPRSTEDESLAKVIDHESAHLLIGHLPEKYKKVISMRYIQDLSLAEISQIVGQSKNTISVQLHRGLEKLKMLYNNYNMA